MADLNLNELRAELEAADESEQRAWALDHGVALLDRVAELEAKVARVKALADEWDDSMDPDTLMVPVVTEGYASRRLRSALAGESDE